MGSVIRRLGSPVILALMLGALPPPAASATGASAGGGRDRMITVPNPGRYGATSRAAATSSLRSRSGADTQGSVAAPAPSAPVSSGGFNAINGSSNISPGDPTGALGDTYNVTAVNVHYAVYDRSGAEVIGRTALKKLFPNLKKGAFTFDPKVVYDPYNDYYYLVFLALKERDEYSRILVVGIPDATAGTRSTWCKRNIKGDLVSGNGSQFADYPDVGYDGKRVTISTNQFGFGPAYPYTGAQVLSIRQSFLDSNCGRKLRYKRFSGKSLNHPNGAQGFSLRPATAAGGDPAGPGIQYMLAFHEDNLFFGKRLTLWRLKPVKGKVKLVKTSLTVGRAEQAPFGTQKDGGVNKSNTWWDTGDLRLINAFFDADTGRLYAAHAVSENVDGGYLESSIRWYEVEPNGAIGSSSVLRKKVFGVANRDMGWPSVATDSAGNLMVTYSRAGAQGAGEYLSAWAAEVTPGNAVTHALLKAGEARYEVFPGWERWGDYNAANRDPADASKVAMFNQYVVANGGGASAKWRQWADLVSSV